MKFQFPTKLIFFSITVYLTLSCNISLAQFQKSSYGVEYLSDKTYYLSLIQSNSDFLLLDIHSKIPNARYDLRYSTSHNFTKQVLYPSKTKHSFLTSSALNGLLKASKIFDSLGYDIVIFDAYRPYSITIQFWELIKNEDYVAIPTKGSMHNRGLAIDLSLWDRKNNQLLDMGTDFDHFTDTAHHSFEHLSISVLDNRKLLKNTMISVGFKPISTEWWHYIWQTSAEHPVLDLDFNSLLKVQKRFNK